MTRTLAWLLTALFVLSVAACDRISQSALDLNVGDCFKVPEDETISDVQRAPCNEPHSGEVFFVGDFPDQDTYPAKAEFTAWAEQHCQAAAFAEYTGRTYEEAEEIDLSWFFPTPDGWGDGDREMTCILVPVGDEEVSVSFRKAP